MSETLLRIISGISIAVIYAVFFQYGGYAYLPLFLFISIVDLIVLNEFFSMFFKKDRDKFVWYTGLCFSLIVVFLIYLDSLNIYRLTGASDPEFIFKIASEIPQITYFSGVVCMLFIIVTGIYNILKSRLTDSIQTISIGLFGILYIPFTISFIFKLRSLPDGAFYIWFVSLITVMTDVWGYFVGKFLGRHKINLPVSPKKTWEGYMGSFVMQLLFSFLFYLISGKYFSIPLFSNIEIVTVSILIFSSSIFGDLFESLIKRNASIKDSGYILPGHGGLLDRVDSIMFSLPIFYFYLSFFK